MDETGVWDEILFLRKKIREVETQLRQLQQLAYSQAVLISELQRGDPPSAPALPRPEQAYVQAPAAH